MTPNKSTRHRGEQLCSSLRIPGPDFTNHIFLSLFLLFSFSLFLFLSFYLSIFLPSFLTFFFSFSLSFFLSFFLFSFPSFSFSFLYLLFFCLFVCFFHRAPHSEPYKVNGVKTYNSYPIPVSHNQLQKSLFWKLKGASNIIWKQAVSLDALLRYRVGGKYGFCCRSNIFFFSRLSQKLASFKVKLVIYGNWLYSLEFLREQRKQLFSILNIYI